MKKTQADRPPKPFARKAEDEGIMTVMILIGLDLVSGNDQRYRKESMILQVTLQKISKILESVNNLDKRLSLKNHKRM